MEAQEILVAGIHTSSGNTPAQSKDVILHKIGRFRLLSREALGFIGFAIFYLRWFPWIELKIKPLDAIIGDNALDHNFPGANFDTASISILEEGRDHILTKPIFQQASI
jgi:hypothetical protein